MRILTGKYKGRLIKMPKGIRPTQNKVRKAIFDILGNLEGLVVLELFSGSGAIGLEALSYGAKEVVFVESNPSCIKVLKENLSYLPPTTYCLLPIDAQSAVKKLFLDNRVFDLILLDPPYYRDVAKKTLKTLSACDILAPDGLVVAQHFKKDFLPDEIENLKLFKQARYADTLLTFYKKCAR